MNGSVVCLTPERLRLLSADELSPPELKELEAHVSLCESCRGALERAAAEPDWRDEVRDALAGEFATQDWSALADFSAEDGPHDGAGAVEQFRKLLGPTDDPRMLGRIAAYEIVGILGRGGMGVVFKGFDAALNRYVAIKMLLPHLAASGAARKRFAREAQAAAAVVHDHVMAIHSVAEWQGTPYLVMPYGRGVSLQKRLSDKGPLEVREILRIGMQTAAGLAAAHAQGLVHRDVKPANILLAEDVERVTLTDFGLARAVDDVSLTRIGVLAGTPQYMSPEQARAKAVDARSDLFSLGSVLYAMCTGRSPFRGDSSYGVLRLITDDEPTPIREINPEIPDWLCAIVSRLMAKQPEDRFSSAHEVAELLESCLAHVQQPTATALPGSLSPLGGASVFGRYRKRYTGVLVMVAMLGLGLAAMLAWQGTVPPDIAGEWTGEDFGAVALEARQPGHYEGSYHNTDSSQLGTMQLKWSRVERRFNGDWEDDDERSGKISLRLVDGEIRGAWTTKKNFSKEPGSVRLGDFLWKRRSEGLAKKAGEDEQPASPEGDSQLLGTQGDESLEGVWELALPPDIAAERPEDQRLRLVFSGDWYGTFRGSQRVSSSRIRVEPEHKPKRIAFVNRISLGDGESRPMRGIFEVTGEGLRLSLAVDTSALPTEFGVEYPEFKRATGKLADEQLEALKRYAASGTPTTDAEGLRWAPGRGEATFDAEEELKRKNTERLMLDFICREAFSQVETLKTLEYTFETKGANGWHSRAEFHADKVRFFIKRQDVTGMWVNDKQLEPMNCASAFNGLKQQYLDANQSLRLKNGVEGANYPITTPHQYMFLWLRGESDDWRWDTIQNKELWERRFAEATYVGAIPKKGKTLEIVDFPQNVEGLPPCVYRVFFARDLGFIPIKFVRRVSATTETSTTMEVSELKSVVKDAQRFVLPLEVDFTETGVDGVSPKQRLTIEIDGESLKVNEPLDESLFTIEPATEEQIHDVDQEEGRLNDGRREDPIRNEPTGNRLAEWPMWGGTSHRNHVATGRMPMEWDLKAGRNMLWKTKLGTGTYSSPVVSGGKVFIGTNNTSALDPRRPSSQDLSCLVCLDQTTGKLLWQYASEKLPEGRVHDWPQIGLCATACVDGERLWIVTNRCEVVCLDTNGFRDGENDGEFTAETEAGELDADVVWKFDMFNTLGVRPLHQAVSNIAVVDGVVLLNTSNGPDESHQKVPAPEAPNFLALDAGTGNVVWQDNSAGEAIVVGGSSCGCSGASPAVATIGGVTQAIFAGREGWLYGFDFADLKHGKTTRLWQFDCNPKASHYLLGGQSTRNTLIASPVVVGERVFIATGRSPEEGEGPGDLWCIDATKRGDISSELVFNNSHASGREPIAPKPLCACDPRLGDFTRPNPNSGAIWRYAGADRDGDDKMAFDEAFHRSISSPTIDDGLLFIPDLSGVLHCVDARTGEGLWSHDLMAATWSSCVIADGKVMIGDEDGDLEILKVARTKQLELGDEVPNFESSIYATPVILDGTLFVATKDSIVAIRSIDQENMAQGQDQ